MKNILPKLLIIALIIAIPSILMLFMSAEKISSPLSSINTAPIERLFNRIVASVFPPKEVPPTPPEVKPDEVYFRINEINEETPNQSSSYVKKYTKIFDVSEQNPDLRIDFVEPFNPTTSSHYMEESTKVSPDRTKITITFTLTSGPANDKYSGWVDGKLIVHIKNIKSASAAK